MSGVAKSSRHRTRRQPPLLLELPARFPQPTLPTLHPGEDPLDIEPAQRILSGVHIGRVLTVARRALLSRRLALEPSRRPASV